MDFGQLLSAYGLPGIIIFAMGCVIVYQQRKIDQITDKRFSEQEARRIESLETAQELTKTIQTFSQATGMLIDKVNVATGRK